MKLVRGVADRLRATPSCQNGYQKMGQVGKRNPKKILHDLAVPAYRRAGAALLGLCLLIPGCRSELSEPLQSGRVLALQGLEGRWVGPVVPTVPTCGTTTSGIMTIGKSGFGFDPFGGSLVVNGKVTPDGHLDGTLVRQGPERQALSLTFTGSATQPDTINGSLASGRCHWEVTLHRG